MTIPSYADIIVQLDVPFLKQPFTYSIPQAIDGPEALQSGDCVVVPFGKQVTLGYIVRRRDRLPAELDSALVKPIICRVLGHGASVPDSVMRTARWVSREYLGDLALAVRMAIPQLQSARLETYYRWTNEKEVSGLSSNQQPLGNALRTSPNPLTLKELEQNVGSRISSTMLLSLTRLHAIEKIYQLLPPRITPKFVLCATLRVTPEIAAAEAEKRAKRAPMQSAALHLLMSFPTHTALPLAVAIEEHGIGRSVWKRLQTELLVDVDLVESQRIPSVLVTGYVKPSKLSVEQNDALSLFDTLANAHDVRPILLHGVTGSGKTEVYLSTIEQALERGKTALVLVPEIALTAQLMGVFRSRLGDRVAVLHSALSDGERRDEWHRIGSGKADVVVGARSAVFAPLSNIGCIIVDEEHEGSYKHESGALRYQARDVAIARARSYQAVTILGSATPSIESYYAATQGHYAKASLLERPMGRSLPSVEIIDQRIKQATQGPKLFSPALMDALTETLESGRQSIIFMNRRGFAKYLLCRQCGYVPTCPACAVSLTLHFGADKLMCHHCGYIAPVPASCNVCSGKKILPYGIGTERIEAELERIFPNARLMRMDRDTVSTKDALPEIIERFRDGQADILIGTQMVAKGLDFHGVTCVGVVAADTSLHIPDFRASERTFQLLAQVAGRAGRGLVPGRVIIQTFNPDHKAIVSASRHDYQSFYDDEIMAREELNYPPFSRLCNVISSHEDQATALRTAQIVAELLLKESDLTVLGPAPCPIARLRNKWRFHVLVKAPVGDMLRIIMRRITIALPADIRGLVVDMDPQSLI